MTGRTPPQRAVSILGILVRRQYEAASDDPD
jgi:hypothetical protein